MDAVLRWAVNHRDWCIMRLSHLSNGKITVFEDRDGVEVDITKEEMAETESRLSKANELIDKHKAPSAQKT